MEIIDLLARGVPKKRRHTSYGLSRNAQEEMRARHKPHRGRQADVLTPDETEIPIRQRKLTALILLQAGKMSHSLIAINDRVRLPIDTVKKLAEMLDAVSL